MQTINIYKHKLIDIAEKKEKDRDELRAYIRSKFKNQVVKRVLLVNPQDIHESIF